jgi:sugar phosphate isomerase/epimerase
MQTRREFGKLAAGTLGTLSVGRLTAVAATSKLSETINGVRVGLESYGMLPYQQDGVVDLHIKTMQQLGLRSCNLQEFILVSPSLRAVINSVGGPDRGAGPNTPEYQVKVKAVDEQWQQWRSTFPLKSLKPLRKKFDDAGIELVGYMPNNLRTAANSTDEDLVRACEIAQALGIHYLTVMFPKSAAKRFVPIAEKYNMKVGIHGRSTLNPSDPDLIATPQDYIDICDLSKNYGIHLDIGNAAAGGLDVQAFIREQHRYFFALAVKDRTMDRKSKPWGQGDSHVKEILQLVRDNRYTIQCWIDCDIPPSPGRTRMDDIVQCLSFTEQALQS